MFGRSILSTFVVGSANAMDLYVCVGPFVFPIGGDKCGDG